MWDPKRYINSNTSDETDQISLFGKVGNSSIDDIINPAPKIISIYQKNKHGPVYPRGNSKFKLIIKLISIIYPKIIFM